VLTEDYIMRMINQALVVLRKILRMKEIPQHQQALQEIDQALEQLLGIKADLIKVLDDESILETLTQNDKLDVDRLYLVAELLKEEGEILINQGKEDEGYISSIRALNFHLEVALDGSLERFPPPHDKIAELLKRLDAIPLDVDTRYTLFCYYEQEKQYTAAKHTLLDLGREPELASEVKEEMTSFFERLLKKPEAELTEAGLTHVEVKRKLEKLLDDRQME
jgi:hypothetical protein